MRHVLAALVALAGLAAVAGWILSSPDMQVAGLEAVPAGEPDVANGELMFKAGGCDPCHATPNQKDGTRLGGGFALPSPFGMFYAPNISPHPGDGIGAWTPQQFLRAVRAGVSPEGRHYYPAFP